MPSRPETIDSVAPKMQKISRLLAFDFGLKRIGVATGNTLTNTTQALSTITSRNGIPDWRGIAELIAQWKPDALVVGLPLEMNGNEGKMCQQARKFGDTLGKRYEIPIHYVDERLTSVSADNLILQAISPGKKAGRIRKAAKDNLAAELILQSYLEAC